MIVTVSDTSRSHGKTGARGQSPTVWGLGCLELHDRFWAAHGVQVVRRGAGRVEPHGPQAYLLLDPDDLVIFSLPRAMKRLRSGRARALLVNVRQTDAQPYSERVLADPSGRLVALRRQYGSQPRSVNPVLVTAGADIASLWARSPNRSTGTREVRLAAGLNRYAETRCPGEVFDATDTAMARRCLTSLMYLWHNPGRTIPGVTCPQPGVWIHRSTATAPGVRFVPPVWIGAGATLRNGDVVIGPCIVNDEVAVPAASPPAFWPPLCSPLPVSGKRPAVSPRTRFGKRLFDIAFSVLALTLVAPLFPIIMLAIWLEDGRPFFFNHTRQTVGGKYFVCYKFRTMCKDAERLKARLSEKNLCDGPQFHIENDPRLLRTGKFLRRFHLDELPQFFNVLCGQMNIIGPRPSPDNENQYCPAWREARLSVRPGLTGLWQVNRTRAPNADFQEWIRYDLDYVDRQSWWLDLWIIYKTTKDILMPRPKREANGRNGRTHGRERGDGLDAPADGAAPTLLVTTASRQPPAPAAKSSDTPPANQTRAAA